MHGEECVKYACGLVVAILAGCATSHKSVVDTLPANEPRGYVDFYAAAGDTLGVPVGITPVRESVAVTASTTLHDVDKLGQDQWLRSRRGVIEGGEHVRIACEPGKHAFSILMLTTLSR